MLQCSRTNKSTRQQVMLALVYVCMWCSLHRVFINIQPCTFATLNEWSYLARHSVAKYHTYGLHKLTCPLTCCSDVPYPHGAGMTPPTSEPHMSAQLYALHYTLSASAATASEHATSHEPPPYTTWLSLTKLRITHNASCKDLFASSMI